MSVQTVFPKVEPSALRPGAAVRILPAGVFRAHDGRPQGLEGWRIDAPNVARLISARPATGSDYVIDYEHQTLNAEKNGKPAPAAGWFKRLEWREGDGLFMADITWTDSARAMIAANEYRHVSPVFRFDPVSGVVTSVVSVALTNNPALTGLVDLAAAKAQGLQIPVDDGLTEKDRATLEHVFGANHGNAKPTSATSQRNGMSCAEFEAAFEGQSDHTKDVFSHVFGNLILDR